MHGPDRCVYVSRFYFERSEVTAQFTHMDWQRHYSSVLLYCSSAMTAVLKDLAARLLFGCEY